MARTKRVVYKPYNLVFYEDEQYLYEALKKVSKAHRRNMRDTLMYALETFLLKGDINVHNPQSMGANSENIEENCEMEQW